MGANIIISLLSSHKDFGLSYHPLSLRWQKLLLLHFFWLSDEGI